MYNSTQYASLLQAPPVTNDNLMDSVSEIRWNKDLLATSCWDGYIRFYQVYLQNLRTAPQLEFKSVIDCQEPVLSISWKQDMSIMFAALADNTIRAYEVRTKQSVILGKHDDCPARQVFWNESMNVLVSLGLDKKINFWSLQSPGKSVHTIELSHIPTVGEQDASEQLFAYADVDSKFRWLNWSALKGNQNSVASRSIFSMEENKLQSQITCIGFGDQQVGYGSADGRALLMNISSRGDLSTKMQYKCHKVDEDQRISAYRTEKLSKMYMCNSIQYNPRYTHWVSTCGSEGQIIFWDTLRKKALAQYKVDGPVLAGQVSQDGSMFAYASGYDWGQGLDKLGDFPSRLGVAVIEERYLQSS